MRETSGRDAALLHALDERDVTLRGKPVSADQLRRWRTWRRVGFIPRSPERIRGYRLGVEISADEVQWVAEAAQLVPRCRSLDDVAWQLARRGWPVEAEGLREVISAASEKLFTQLDDVTRSGDESSPRVKAIYRADTRHRRGRGGGRVEHVHDVVVDLAQPGRIEKARRAVRIASAADIAEAVRWSATPLEALDVLTGFPPAVLQARARRAGRGEWP